MFITYILDIPCYLVMHLKSHVLYIPGRNMILSTDLRLMNKINHKDDASTDDFSCSFCNKDMIAYWILSTESIVFPNL
jgi:hypothetical protein